MRLVLEPERWKKLVKAALIYKSSSLISNPVAECTEKGIKIADMSEGSVAVFLLFPVRYFLEYQIETGKTEFLPITEALMNCLSLGFKSEKITVEIGNEEITITDGRDEYRVKKLEKTPEPFTIPIEIGEFGVSVKTSEKTGEVLARVLVDDSELDLAKSDLYEFLSDGKSLWVVMNLEEGSFKRKLEVKKTDVLKSLDVYLDGEYYQHIIENLEGEVWVTLTPNVAVFSKTSKDYAFAYILATSLPTTGE